MIIIVIVVALASQIAWAIELLNEKRRMSIDKKAKIRKDDICSILF
jgi:hypothetical protein